MKNSNGKSVRPAFVVIVLLLGVIAYVLIERLSLLEDGANVASTANSTSQLPQSNETARLKQINDMVIELAGGVKQHERYSDRYAAIREAIKRADFEIAQRLIGKVRDESVLTHWGQQPYVNMFSQIQGNQDELYIEKLTEWIDSDSNNPIPLLLRAYYYHTRGWAARGTGFISSVSDEASVEFESDMYRAIEDVDRAIEKGEGAALYRNAKLKLMFGAASKEDIDAAFEYAIDVDAENHTPYQYRLRLLQPKWGGSVEEMESFVKKYADTAGESSFRKLLYLQNYVMLLDAMSLHCTSYQGEKRGECVYALMNQIVTDEMIDKVKSSLDLYNHVDHWDYLSAFRYIVGSSVTTQGAERATTALLQMAAETMGGDIQLMPDKEDNNNHVIDSLVAKVWQYKGNYDAAEKMYMRAIKNIDATSFSSEMERNSELAYLYDQIARTLYSKKEYTQGIAYQRVAEMLDGPGRGGESYYQCLALYEYKMYREAVRFCSEDIDKGSNVDSAYWRAESYIKLGDYDSAFDDLLMLADRRGSNKRVQAALMAGYYYTRRRGMEKALDVYNRYTYLYDERFSDRQSIAISYNNRCYVKKQLKMYEDALEDCNASLRYGEIPDAYQKQRELLKILGRESG